MNLWNRLMYYGLWSQPVTMLLLYGLYRYCRPGTPMPRDLFMLFLVLSFLPCMYIYINNTTAYKNGKRDFRIGDGISTRNNADYHTTTKRKAMYPNVNPALLRDTRDLSGIIFGRWNARYVTKPLSEDGHVFLIGGSGSGKSSAVVIPTLLANPDAAVIAVDIKGELSFKSVRSDSDNVCVFNPNDRSQYGYNPFYRLHKNSTNQEITEVMQEIAYSLIPLPVSVHDPFWKNSARNLLTGLMIYHFKHTTRDFVSVMDAILEQTSKESIAEVVENAPPSTPEFRYIIQFHDMADETLSGIFSELCNHIVIFSNDQNIRYAFQENPKKVHPLLLEEHKHIFLSIREEKLAAYYDVLQLIINQSIRQLEVRPEDSHPVLFVLDELPRILSAGKLEKLLDGARTLRSRHVTLFLVTQSMEALMGAFTEHEVTDLISNCPYILVLSATSQKTQQAVIAWSGQYMEKKHSESQSKGSPSTSIAYEKTDIVEASDLMKLPLSGEAILISPFGYCRINKTPYYMDKYFCPRAQEIINYNQTIQELEESIC